MTLKRNPLWQKHKQVSLERNPLRQEQKQISFVGYVLNSPVYKTEFFQFLYVSLFKKSQGAELDFLMIKTTKTEFLLQ